MTAGETRHLYRRHQTWWLKLRAPRDLARLYPGEPKIVRRNLKTHNVNEARRRRHVLVTAEHARWQAMRERRAAQRADLSRLATAEMHRFLAELGGRHLDDNEHLDDLVAEANTELLSGRLDVVATTLLRAEGLAFSSDTVDALAELLANARRTAISAWLQGIDLQDRATAHAGKSGAVRGTLLSAAIADYLAELRRPDSPMTAKGVVQVEQSLRLLASCHADGIRLDEVTRRVAGQFVADLQKLHPDYRRDPEVRSLSLKQLITKHPPRDGVGLAAPTIARHVSNIRNLVRWAEGRGLIPANPWNRPAVPKGGEAVGHLLYTMTELQQLAAAQPAAPAEVAYAFKIALYSGLRLGEVTSIDAIVLDGPMPYLDLARSRRKTRSSSHRAPVHPELLPHLRGVTPLHVDAAQLGKAFARWKAKAGVTRAETDFHSLRKNATGV